MSATTLLLGGPEVGLWASVPLPSSFFDDLAVNGDVGDIPSDQELALGFWYKRTGPKFYSLKDENGWCI